MNGGQDHVIVIEQWRAGAVTGRFRRVERDLGQETFAIGMATRQGDELVEVECAHLEIVVQALQMRRIPVARQLQVLRPAQARGAQARIQRAERLPLDAAAGRHRERRQRGGDIAALAHRVQHTGGSRLADSGNQLQHAEPGQAPAWILGKAQQRQQILDMRGLQEFQAAELDERDVAPHELQFERGAVAGRPKQHGLRLEGHAFFALLENAAADPARLLGFVGNQDQLRLDR